MLIVYYSTAYQIKVYPIFTFFFWLNPCGVLRHLAECICDRMRSPPPPGQSRGRSDHHRCVFGTSVSQLVSSAPSSPSLGKDIRKLSLKRPIRQRSIGYRLISNLWELASCQSSVSGARLVQSQCAPIYSGAIAWRTMCWRLARVAPAQGVSG